jgi:tol-pal system protein YbgF
MKLKSSLFVFIISFFAFSNVEAANVNSLERELNALKEDLKIVQRKLYNNENNGVDEFSDNAANLQVKIGEYEALIREAIGRVDEMDHKLSNLENKIDMMNKDIQLRFKQIEGGSVTKKLEVPRNSKDAKEVKPLGEPAKIENAIERKEITPVKSIENVLSADKLYEKAFNLLKQGKYMESETEFELFLKNYPEDKLAGNAQYWLGESYYVRKDYTRSVVAFAKGFEKYKNGSKGADSLLKLGMSMKALKKKKEACAAFMIMEKEFPKAMQSLKDKAKEQAEIMSCK